MADRLAGKVAVVTGTGGGQGRTAAVVFAREGALVVGAGVDPAAGAETARMVAEAGGEMLAVYPCDLSSEEDASRVVAAAVSAFGRVDILYNNAVASRRGGATELSYEDFRFTMDHALAMPWLMTRAVVPHMRRAGSGCIVNVSSISGISGGTGTPANLPFTFATSIAKAGVIRMTELLAIELAPFGIRVNTLSPGLVDTPRSRSFLGPDNEPLRRATLAQNLFGRPGEPEEVVAAAVFLASDESSYVTGHNLVVDGGWTCCGGSGLPDPELAETSRTQVVGRR